MGYLNQDDILDYTQFIHLPPEGDSLLFAYDKSLFEKGQALKGTEAWDELLQKLAGIAHTGILFNEIPGINISESSTPKTYALLGKIKDDYKLMTDKAKNIYKRKSAYQFYNFLTPPPYMENAKNNASYPSGHGNYITASALILSYLTPEKVNDIMKKGADACDMIVTAGLHWYTDVEAGKFLGGVLYNRLLTVPQFKADLEECRSEFC